jgi:hypothetical protein
MDKEKEITGIEPHSIVNSGRSFDSFEETIFTLVWEKLFNSMTTKEFVLDRPLRQIVTGIDFNEEGEPYIDFRPSDFTKKGFDFTFNKLESMSSKPIRICNDMNEVFISFFLFSMIENKFPFVRCYFSSTVLKYLLYFGVGEGGCFFNVLACIKMQTAINQRLYRLMKSNQNKGNKTVTISVTTLKDKYNVPDYDFTQIEKRILKHFQEKLLSNNYSDIAVKYEPIYETNRKRIGRPAVIAIKFTILKKK